MKTCQEKKINKEFYAAAMYSFYLFSLIPGFTAEKNVKANLNDK